MRPKNFKGGRCIKSKLKKCDEVARTYDKIQTAYAEVLDRDKNIEKIKCNVLLENLEDGEFTTDFLCTKTNGDLMVRECVFRKKLSLPRTCKLLDASRKYWAINSEIPKALITPAFGIPYFIFWIIISINSCTLFIRL